MKFLKNSRGKTMAIMVVFLTLLNSLITPILPVLALTQEGDIIDYENKIEDGGTVETDEEETPLENQTDSEEGKDANHAEDTLEDSSDDKIQLADPIEDTVEPEIDTSRIEDGWIKVGDQWAKIVSQETLDEDALYLNQNDEIYYKGLPLHEYNDEGYYPNSTVQSLVGEGARQKLIDDVNLINLEDITYEDPNPVKVQSDAMFRTFSAFSTTQTNAQKHQRHKVQETGKLRDKSSGIVNTGQIVSWGRDGHNTPFENRTRGNAFLVQGSTAFCIEFDRSGPATNQSGYSNLSPHSNDKILKALYYGWGGPENVFPNTTQGWHQGTVITTLILSKLYYKDAPNREYLQGYDLLWDKVNDPKVETPNTNVRFTTSRKDNKVTVSVSNGLQKSNTITFDTFSKNSTTINLSGNVELVRTKSKSGRGLKTYKNNVTIYGGDEFHFTAPLNKDEDFVLEDLRGSLPLYTPVITRTSANYQELGSLESWHDPANKATITVPFQAQTATVTINHVDLSRPKSHNKRIFKTEKKSVTIGTSYTAKRMSQTVLNRDYDQPYVHSPKADHPNEKTVKKVSSSGNTINLYYTTKWNVRVRHIDRSRATTHSKRVFKEVNVPKLHGETYSVKRWSKTKLRENFDDPYIKHPDYEEPAAVTIARKDVTIDLQYTTEWDLTVHYKDNQNGSTFRNVGTTKYIYGASYKHVSPEWSTNTGKNSVRHYDKKHYDYRNDYGGKTSRTEANRTKSGEMPRKNLTIEFTFDPHGYAGVEWKNLFPEKGYDVFDKTLNPKLSGTRTGDEPINKVGNNVVWTGIASDLRTKFDMYKYGTTFEYSQPEFIEVNDRVYQRENDTKYTGKAWYQVYPVQTGSTYTPHQFKYRLIREVTVNYLDDRTGEPIAEPKKYEVKQGYNPSTGKEPKVTNTLLNNGYAWSEEPPVFKDDKTEYEYNYVRHDGSPESGVVGTDHIEINYYYNQPLAKVELEKLQIYTAKSDEGLPVIVDLGKVLNYETGLTDNDNKDMTITLALYEGDVKLDKKVYTANEFPSKAEFKVETNLLENSGTTGLTINENRPYTVKLEDYDPNHFRVDDAVDWRGTNLAGQIITGKGKLTTDGYTSSEETVTFNPSGVSRYEYVVMTEITPTTPMKKFYETFEFNVTQLDKQKSGYGVATDLEYTYTNELNDKYNFATSVSDPDDSGNKPDFIFNAPEELKDETLNHFKSSGWVSLTMEDTVNSRVISGSQPFKYNVKYDFPNINVEKQTGNLYTDEQVTTLGLDSDTLRNAGNLFFSPVWSEIKDYDVYYSILEQGAHKVNFSIEDVWEIYAQMMLTIDSNTKDLDEIVFSPINADRPFAGGNPDNWTDTDKEWLMYWKEEEN